MKVAVKKPVAGAHTRTSAKPAPRGRVASVADAKANLTSLLREVEQHHVEITVLRRGTPIARIAPIDTARPVSGFGWMRGSVQELGDITGPTGETWDDDEDVA